MKKLFIGIVSVLALCACLLPVSALGSTDVNGTVTGEVSVNGEVVDNSRAEFSEVLATIEDEKLAEVITKLNEGNEVKDVLAEAEVKLPEGVELNVADVKLLTIMQDLVAYDADGKKIEGPVTLSWEVPNLKEGLGDVYVLHYSTVRNVWEVLSPESVDFATKTITCSFEDLSPVAVVYKAAEATVEPSVAPTTTPTETVMPTEQPVEDTAASGNTGLYMGIAVVAIVIVAGVVYFAKKK